MRGYEIQTSETGERETKPFKYLTHNVVLATGIFKYLMTHNVVLATGVFKYLTHNIVLATGIFKYLTHNVVLATGIFKYLTTQNLGPIGSAVLKFIGYKFTFLYNIFFNCGMRVRFSRQVDFTCAQLQGL